MSDEPRIFTVAQQRAFPAADGRDGRGRMREIPVESSAFGYATDTSVGWRSDDTLHLVCSHMIHSARLTECWATIARLLKAGDRLELRWVADNNTGSITEAGLHCDRLRLLVHRSPGPLVLAITTSVSRTTPPA
jgi:hypothetical protein